MGEEEPEEIGVEAEGAVTVVAVQDMCCSRTREVRRSRLEHAGRGKYGRGTEDAGLGFGVPRIRTPLKHRERRAGGLSGRPCVLGLVGIRQIGKRDGDKVWRSPVVAGRHRDCRRIEPAAQEDPRRLTAPPLDSRLESLSKLQYRLGIAAAPGRQQSVGPPVGRHREAHRRLDRGSAARRNTENVLPAGPRRRRAQTPRPPRARPDRRSSAPRQAAGGSRWPAMPPRRRSGRRAGPRRVGRGLLEPTERPTRERRSAGARAAAPRAAAARRREPASRDRGRRRQPARGPCRPGTATASDPA